MMDALAIEAAEAATHCGYPPGAGAVLVIELDGPTAEVEHELAEAERYCREHGAFEFRVATDPEERALIWKGRKSAFAAVGRISPDYIVQDGVIPRTALPEVLRAIADLSSSSGVRVANVFHAGDGNLHPLVLFDDAVEGAGAAAEEVRGAILDLCISHGGSITGEHGVGSDLEATRSALSSACGEVAEAGHGDAVDGVRPALVARPGSTEEVAAVLRVSAERGLAVVPRGAGTKVTWGRPPERADLVLDVS